MTIINNNKLIIILVILLVFTEYFITADNRSLDGESNNKANPNAGTPKSEFTREIEKKSWPDETLKAMVSTPGEYTAIVPKTSNACTTLPKGQFPLPRCVSNLVNGLQAKIGEEFDLGTLDAKKSLRKTSHVVRTFVIFVLFLVFKQKFTNHLLFFFCFFAVDILGTIC